MAVDGPHVDQRAPLLLVHVLDAGLGGEEGAIEVDGEHLFPVAEREFLNRMDDLNAGIRHKNIDLPKRLDRMFDARIDLVLLRHIHADADRRFLARQLLGRRVRGIGIQISDDHPAVFLQIALGNGMTDTAGGAGNEGYIAIKLHTSSSSSSSSTLNEYTTIAVNGPSLRSLSALIPSAKIAPVFVHVIGHMYGSTYNEEGPMRLPLISPSDLTSEQRPAAFKVFAARA